jgi:hypothetical protein
VLMGVPLSIIRRYSKSADRRSREAAKQLSEDGVDEGSSEEEDDDTVVPDKVRI